MVWLYVNDQFQVKPLSTGTSSSWTKKNSSQNASMDSSKVCTKFWVSSPSLSKKSGGGGGGAAHDKSRGSNLISNSSRTNISDLLKQYQCLETFLTCGIAGSISR